jgi:hypothetical protein
MLTHNADTAEGNRFIADSGWDDNSASTPQITVTVTSDGGDVSVGSVTVAGYDASGRETGSTAVNAGQVVSAGQSLTFTADDPWQSVTAWDQWGNPTVYDPGAASCAAVSWSSL